MVVSSMSPKTPKVASALRRAMKEYMARRAPRAPARRPGCCRAERAACAACARCTPLSCCEGACRGRLGFAIRGGAQGASCGARASAAE